MCYKLKNNTDLFDSILLYLFEVNCGIECCFLREGSLKRPIA